MTNDEKLAEYMHGYAIGVMDCLHPGHGELMREHYRPKGEWGEAAERGLNAGRHAYAFAAQRERELLEGICSACHGHGFEARDGAPCHHCGGSGSDPVMEAT